jgi:hypothetical protein
MRYLLSFVVPVAFRSNYSRVEDDGSLTREHASWVQWRGRIFRHKVTV